MEKTALLIIDVQSAMFSLEKKPHNGEQLLKNIQALLEKARQSKLPVVYVQHNAQQGPFAMGSPTWEIPPPLLRCRANLLFTRHFVIRSTKRICRKCWKSSV